MLKEETEHWTEVQEDMSLALKEMRVDPPPITVKMPNQSNASLLERRKKTNVPATIMETQMSTEENN